MKVKAKKDEYLAKIIHDLKTPTVAQIRALELFLDTSCDKLSQDEKDLIELTLQSCNYMQSLIETFGAVHKLDYEQIHLNYDKFDIVELVKEILDELNILFRYYELKFELSTLDEIIVNADKLQIKRVIENILSNAINHAFKNSTIYVALSVCRNEFTIEVRNNSPYIEPKILKEIFEKFKTYPSYYNRAGIGLGLYLSKEIIHAHFGKMIARSYCDNVNVFGFNIPVT